MKKLLAVILAMGMAPVAHASVAVSSFTVDTTSTAASISFAYTTGYQFTIADPITVTALGYYDIGGNGLAVSHDIGIWTPASGPSNPAVLLTSATVPTTGTPQDGYYYVDLSTALPLAAGTYVVGGFSGLTDPFVTTATGITMNAALTSVLFVQTYGSVSSLTVPDFNGYVPNQAQYMSVNFQFTANTNTEQPPTQDVPEPASLALLALGIAGLGAARRKAA